MPSELLLLLATVAAVASVSVATAAAACARHRKHALMRWQPCLLTSVWDLGPVPESHLVKATALCPCATQPAKCM